MMPVMKKTAGAAIPPEIRIGSIVARVRHMLKEFKRTVPEGTASQISHPYGLEMFESYGAVFIQVADQECFKKLVVQLPGQQYPSHRHLHKQENYHVLAGDLEVEVEGAIKMLHSDDRLTIHPGETHGFRSWKGMIMEETSTSDIKGDSFYTDKAIPFDSSARKSAVIV